MGGDCVKALICVKQIEQVVSLGNRKICIEPGTLITAAAQDLAKEKGITFEMEDNRSSKKKGSFPAVQTFAGQRKNFDKEFILQLVKEVLKSQGMLVHKPYEATVDRESGLKIVRGNSITYDVLDTKQCNTQVTCQEVIHQNEAQTCAGFLTMNDSTVQWTLSGYEETDMIVEGKVTININGNTYTAQQGDVIFIPEKSDVVWNVDEHVKLFYTRYFANKKRGLK